VRNFNIVYSLILSFLVNIGGNISWQDRCEVCFDGAHVPGGCSDIQYRNVGIKDI